MDPKRAVLAIRDIAASLTVRAARDRKPKGRVGVAPRVDSARISSDTRRRRFILSGPLFEGEHQLAHSGLRRLARGVTSASYLH